MNKYMHLNRLEFAVTRQCSGNCKHCSVETGSDAFIDTETAVTIVNELSNAYSIDSIMTFGGEPLLYADTVCAIHEAAANNGIEKREIITNGYFAHTNEAIDSTARQICRSNVIRILLSVDAFHQESIPVEPVLYFAESLLRHGFTGLSTHPAWLVNEQHDNPYNRKTKELLDMFRESSIEPSHGNNIFPAGNAVKYLPEYFPKPDRDTLFVPCGTLPYTDKIDDVNSISVNPNGDIIICSFSIGNIHEKHIIEIIDNYDPYRSEYTKMLVEGGVQRLYDSLMEQGFTLSIDDCYSSCMVCHKIWNTLRLPAL